MKKEVLQNNGQNDFISTLKGDTLKIAHNKRQNKLD